MVSVLEKLNDKVVKLSVYKGVEDDSIIKFKTCGCKLLTFIEHVSSSNCYKVKDENLSVSRELTVGGENNPLIDILNSLLIHNDVVEENLIVIV